MSRRDLIRFTSLELWEMDREEEEELGEGRPVKNTNLYTMQISVFLCIFSVLYAKTA